MIKSLLKIWEKFVEYLFKISLLLSFIGFVPIMISIYYYLFVNYDPLRIIMNILVLVTFIFTNLKLQGGRVI